MEIEDAEKAASSDEIIVWDFRFYEDENDGTFTKLLKSVQKA